MKFATNDQFEDSKQLTGLFRSDNLYVLPKEIKYDDFINSQFDEILKKKGLKPEPKSMTEKNADRGDIKKHILVEVEI